MTPVTELETLDELREFSTSSNLSVVYFHCDNCKECLVFAPIYNSWAKSHPNTQWAKFNIRKLLSLKSFSHAHAMSTFIFYKNGKKLIRGNDPDVKSLRASILKLYIENDPSGQPSRKRRRVSV